MSRPRSVRTRLTLTFAVVFALGGALLLGAAYAIVVHSIPGPVRATDLPTAVAPTVCAGGAASCDVGTPARRSGSGERRGADAASARRFAPAALAAVQDVQGRKRTASLRDVMWWFLAALGIVSAGSLAAGWHVAGRALAPVSRITAAAREISADRLDARIALTGPPDELRELGDTFDEMLDRLERAFVAERRFVASASHELRTPLTLIRTEAEVALGDPGAPPGELREALASVLSTADRGTALVAALLLLARGEQPLEVAGPVDLAVLVAEGVAAARPDAARAEVELTCSGSTTAAAVVRGDGALLRSLVDNLLANAIAYNRPSGWVRVAIETDADTVRFVVANRGPAIAADAVAGLFEPFARGEPSRSRRTGGAGLGLAIVRAVAQVHAATIRPRPGEEGGLVVAVVFPAFDLKMPPQGAI